MLLSRPIAAEQCRCARESVSAGREESAGADATSGEVLNANGEGANVSAGRFGMRVNLERHRLLATSRKSSAASPNFIMDVPHETIAARGTSEREERLFMLPLDPRVTQRCRRLFGRFDRAARSRAFD
jgi:hypothetical protein